MKIDDVLEDIMHLKSNKDGYTLSYEQLKCITTEIKRLQDENGELNENLKVDQPMIKMALEYDFKKFRDEIEQVKINYIKLHSHYEAALENWNLTITERDKLKTELAEERMHCSCHTEGGG